MKLNLINQSKMFPPEKRTSINSNNQGQLACRHTSPSISSSICLVKPQKLAQCEPLFKKTKLKQSTVHKAAITIMNEKPLQQKNSTSQPKLTRATPLTPVAYPLCASTILTSHSPQVLTLSQQQVALTQSSVEQPTQVNLREKLIYNATLRNSALIVSQSRSGQQRQKSQSPKSFRRQDASPRIFRNQNHQLLVASTTTSCYRCTPDKQHSLSTALQKRSSPAKTSRSSSNGQSPLKKVSSLQAKPRQMPRGIQIPTNMFRPALTKTPKKGIELTGIQQGQQYDSLRSMIRSTSTANTAAQHQRSPNPEQTKKQLLNVKFQLKKTKQKQPNLIKSKSIFQQEKTPKFKPSKVQLPAKLTSEEYVATPPKSQRILIKAEQKCKTQAKRMYYFGQKTPSTATKELQIKPLPHYTEKASHVSSKVKQPSANLLSVRSQHSDLMSNFSEVCDINGDVPNETYQENLVETPVLQQKELPFEMVNTLKGKLLEYNQQKDQQRRYQPPDKRKRVSKGEQRKIVQSALLKKREVAQQGGHQEEVNTKRFLVSAAWWRQWCDYVNFTEKRAEFEIDEKNQLVSQQYFSESDVSSQSSDQFYARPSQILNGPLLDQDGRLLKNITEHHDFETVSQVVWEHLTTWYGHDHKICRRLVRDTFNQVKLDLYPDVYQQSRFNTTVNPTLYNFVTQTNGSSMTSSIASTDFQEEKNRNFQYLNESELHTNF